MQTNTIPISTCTRVIQEGIIPENWRGQAPSQEQGEWELAAADWCNTEMQAFCRDARNLVVMY